MKKVWILIITLIIAINLPACNKKVDKIPPQNAQETGQTNTEKPKEEEQSKEEEKPKEEEKKPESPVIEEKPQEEAFKIPGFTSEDLDGNEVTDDFFANNKLTVLNIWTTTWPSCITEIPALQEVEEKYKDKGVRVLGILADSEVETGKSYMSKKGANYVNILPTDSLIDGFLDEIMYVPTTLLVNSKGVLLGEIMAGTLSFEEFSKLIDDAL